MSSGHHYNDVVIRAIASQITSLTIVYSTVYSDADRRKHQISASLAFVRGNHRGPGNSPHKWPVTRKMFPFDDVIIVHINRRDFILDPCPNFNGDLFKLPLFDATIRINNYITQNKVWDYLSMPFPCHFIFVSKTNRPLTMQRRNGASMKIVMTLPSGFVVRNMHCPTRERSKRC